ncbi:MAG: hypothetical protein KC621_21235 [Myxococcales bacterium]|nr:hypothetical protein [Myxococcales bacterium]
MERRFALPTLSALALSAASGCTSDAALVGEWTLGTWTYDGVLYRFPEEYTYVDGDVSYTYTHGALLVVQDDGQAAFGTYYQYTSSEGDFYREEYLYAGDWEKAQRRTWAMSFDEWELDMDCTLSDGELDCDGEMYGETVTMSFVSAEEA